MRRIILSLAHVFLIISASESQTVEEKEVIAGGTLILDCPPIQPPTEQFGSLSWKKDNLLYATMGTNMKADFAMSSPRFNITSEMQLKVTDVKKEDAGSYMCQIFVMLGSSSEQREQTYDVKVLDVPSPPGKPKLKEVQSREMTVEWTEPDNINNSPILNYTLKVRLCSGSTANDKDFTTNNDALEMTVTGLSPYTCYIVRVIAINSVGPSLLSLPTDPVYTDPEAPGAPPDPFKAVEITNTSITLAWESPKESDLNGELKGFVIEYGQKNVEMQPIPINDPDRKKYVLKDLDPNTNYDVSILATNSAGEGPKREMMVKTKEGLPSKPRIYDINNQQATSLYVNWEPPQTLNGELISYELQWNYTKGNKSEVKRRIITGHFTNPMTAFIQDLDPYTQYKVKVAAETNGGKGEFSEEFPAFTDVAAPGPPRNFSLVKKGSNYIHLSWQNPLRVNKGVDNYLIKGWNNRGGNLEEVIPGDKTEWNLTILQPNTRYHIKVAAITKAIFSQRNWVGDFTDPLIIMLGNPNAVTGTGNEAGIHPGLIAAIVGGLIILVIVIILVVGYRFYTCRKWYQAAYYYLAVPSNGQTPVQQTIITVEEPSEEKHYPDIGVEDFIHHVEQMHTDSDIAFSQEFDEINRTSYSDKYACDNSNAADNRNKNRYINIVAYDHSRVILKTEIGRLRQSDYINANYVDGYKKARAYIATQGPLPQTFPDFWRMVWEQNTNVIVMITNLMEKGRRKCDQYWPTDSVETYGNMQVKLITTVPRAHYTVRVFSLRNMKVKKRHSMKSAAERTVYHYHYTEWPDHGVPDYSLPVLSFVQKSAAQSGPEQGPIIVHCSAGVGRTGTYILIDSMIAQIEDKRSINIPGFTQQIRRQRNFLVQTEDQYIFIHEVLVEYLLGNGATEVKKDKMSDHLLQLELPPQTQIIPAITTATILERQYQLITDYTPKEQDLSAALKPCNQEKNRVGSILPVNLKRVFLPVRPGVEGSDYINASYLQSYKKSSEFIVTQHPTEDTMEDFWRMVWDKNSPVLVVLSPFDDLEYKEFWPPKGSSIEVDSGNFRLAMKDEPIPSEEQGYTTMEFILDSIQYDYTLMTRIIVVTDWPRSCKEFHSVFDIISHAHSFLNSLECGPIIVMDQFGGVEAGTFCALWTLRDQMLAEKCADFYQVCKLYHHKRPGIVGTLENYRFLHQAMASLYKHNQEELGNGSSPRNHHHHNPFHHGSTRRNGTLPRTNANTSNSNSNTLPRSSANMGRSNSGDSNSATTPTGDGKVETNI